MGLASTLLTLVPIIVSQNNAEAVVPPVAARVLGQIHDLIVGGGGAPTAPPAMLPPAGKRLPVLVRIPVS
jgi:hypothetical protein